VRTLQCRRMAKLPALNDGEDLVALSATVDGRLAAVSASGSRRSRLPDLRGTSSPTRSRKSLASGGTDRSDDSAEQGGPAA
jgi:hypothetical protein